MSESHRDRSAGVLFAKTAILIVCAVGFERGFAAFERRVPREVFFEPSFTLGFLQHTPLLLVIFALGLWPLISNRTSRFGWAQTDSVGGLRWIVSGVAVMLAWTHAGHPINDYYGQAHVLDRWLLLGLAFATLRSPLVIAIFIFELSLTRVQLYHPVNSLAPIGDELSIRLLGAVFATAFLNLVTTSTGIKRIRRGSRASATEPRIDTPCLVFAILCFIGSYYGYSGIAKLTIGNTPIDWIREAHLENLFVGAYLNGWNLVGRPESILAFAKTVAMLSVPIALLTVMIECCAVLLLVHRHFTLVLVAIIVTMHVGIILLSGIFFWQWLGIDLMLAVWLFSVRNDPEIRSIYSRRNAVVSVASILLIMLMFGLNEFTWWNTRWVSIVDTEVRDASGRSYRVDPADFHPYTLRHFIHPPGTKPDRVGFGTTSSQTMMERLQDTDPASLRAFLEHRRTQDPSKTLDDQRRDATDFMVRVFRNRNARVAKSGIGSHRVFPFLVSAPALHMRSLRDKNLYRDQSPVVEVLIRHIQVFYTGDELVRLGDEVLHTVPIPAI